MSLDTLLRRTLIFIAIVTVLSGALQLFLPDLVLRILSAETTATSGHFFATVGMFMVVVGGLLWQALRQPQPPRLVLPWIALQKLAASALVVLGVARGLFAWLALGVAGFDLLSGLLALWYWRRLAATQR
ncbi:MAG: patatin [Betaproteobacteria bacterium]|nr:MAG: patatin [Betaproteobacteria bacterium]